MSCTGLPVVRESALRPYKVLSKPFSRRWSPDLQSILLAYALIPAAQQEAGIIRVVIEVVVREKEIINLRWKQSSLDQLATTGALDRKYTEYPDVSVYWQYVSGILCNVILPPLGNVR